MASKRYIFLFFVFSSAILVVICLFNYTVDPFFQYRVQKDKYMLVPRFVNPGLLKNYDYDLLLLGSSMIQLLDMSDINEKFDSKGLKIGNGAMNVKEIQLLYGLAKKEDVNTFIVNLDILTFAETYEYVKSPKYLLNNDVISRLQYLVSYETTRFSAVNLYVGSEMEKGKDVPYFLRLKTDLDRIGDFSYNISPSKVGVIHYFNARITPLAPFASTEKMYEYMVLRFEELLTTVDLEKYKDKDYIFFLPPYSAIYWHAAKVDGYYEVLQRFVEYIVERTDKYENVRFVCMYDMDYITDLNTYSDMLHYAPPRAVGIVDALAGSEYDLTLENIGIRLQRLDSLVVSVENTDWMSY